MLSAAVALARRSPPSCKPALCPACFSAAWLPYPSQLPIVQTRKGGTEHMGKWSRLPREDVAGASGQTCGPSAEAARPRCAVCISGSFLPLVPLGRGGGGGGACAMFSFWSGGARLGAGVSVSSVETRRVSVGGRNDDSSAMCCSEQAAQAWTVTWLHR